MSSQDDEFAAARAQSDAALAASSDEPQFVEPNPTDVQPPIPTPPTKFRIEVEGEYADDRYAREDVLAADLREFLVGRGIATAYMWNSAGEVIDLTGEPIRDGV